MQNILVLILILLLVDTFDVIILFESIERFARKIANDIIFCVDNTEKTCHVSTDVNFCEKFPKPYIFDLEEHNIFTVPGRYHFVCQPTGPPRKT